MVVRLDERVLFCEGDHPADIVALHDTSALRPAARVPQPTIAHAIPERGLGRRVRHRNIEKERSP